MFNLINFLIFKWINFFMFNLIFFSFLFNLIISANKFRQLSQLACVLVISITWHSIALPVE